MVRVILESRIDAHATTLYKPGEGTLENVLAGWSHLDALTVDRYHRCGYVLIRGGFSTDEIAGAVGELEHITLSDTPPVDAIYYEGALCDTLAQCASAPAAAGADLPFALGSTSNELPHLAAEVRASFVRKAMGFGHAANPHLHAITSNPELLSAASKLSASSRNGEDTAVAVMPAMRLFQDMAMIKPPGGREKPWHQDHAYFKLPLETPIVGVWIALGSVTAENGAMTLLPGQHIRGPRRHAHVRDFQMCDADIEASSAERVCVPMEAGDVLLFDGKLPHGTATNLSSSRRWAVQLHYIPQEAKLLAGAEAEMVAGAFGGGAEESC